GGFIHVCVEGVAGEVREVLDVVERDFPGFGFELIAKRQIVKFAAERVLLRLLRRHAGDVAADDGRERARMALKRGALHVMCDAANAAHLFAAAGATGAAVNEMRHRRAVAGTFLRAVAIDESKTAM